jgi:hypothetical protein
MRFSLAVLALSLAVILLPCRAFCSAEDVVTDPVALQQLEDRAAHASPRDQCFLYTELVRDYTDVAGKELASGDIDKASVTLKRVQSFAAKIHVGLASDTRKLKDAELRMHTATHHLAQYMHLASTDDQALMASTLKELDRVNTELLAQVFAH